MTNIIYQIDTYHSSCLSSLQQFNYNNMLIYGSYSVREYAKRIGCEYELIRPNLIGNNPWVTAMLEKTNIFNRLLESHYSHFAFFDLDTKISTDAVNIFELTKENEFIIHVVDDSWADKQKRIIKTMTSVDVPNYLLAAAYSCGRPIAQKISKYIKEDFYDLRTSDERFLSYVIEVEKIPLFNLKKFHRQFPHFADFVHYPLDLKEFMYIDLGQEQIDPNLYRDKRFYEVRDKELKIKKIF